MDGLDIGNLLHDYVVCKSESGHFNFYLSFFYYFLFFPLLKFLFGLLNINFFLLPVTSIMGSCTVFVLFSLSFILDIVLFAIIVFSACYVILLNIISLQLRYT